MTNKEAIEELKPLTKYSIDKTGTVGSFPMVHRPLQVEALNLAIKALEDRPTGEWIPVKWHYITEEERAEEGYPKDWVYYIDSPMPDDEERILIQSRGGDIIVDTNYEDDGCYLDSGYDWRTDIVAWMPLPKPYEEAENE